MQALILIGSINGLAKINWCLLFILTNIRPMLIDSAYRAKSTGRLTHWSPP
jgi:hypothetical protein